MVRRGGVELLPCADISAESQTYKLNPTQKRFLCPVEFAASGTLEFAKSDQKENLLIIFFSLRKNL